jgi:hypothetical protein
MEKMRKILECVPEEQFDWAPHVKSFTLGKLVNHIAVIPGFTAMIVNGQGKRTGEAKSKKTQAFCFKERRECFQR